MVPLNQAKPGFKIIFHDTPYEIVEAKHLMLGRGGAKLITKLRNLMNQSIIDHTFHGEEKIVEADIEYQPAQLLYCQNDLCFVMVKDTYEQKTVKIRNDKRRFLTDGADIDLINWQDQVIDIKLPKKINLKVDYTEPGFKGDTVSASTKIARLESGLELQVPLFIKTGDLITVNTDTSSYDSRN